MKHIVVLSGAGISAESGLKTFRDSDGLWEGHDVMEVATPEGFAKNPELVLEFYNQRRRQLKAVEPNSAHFDLASLEQDYKVTIITQNVDDLHERAGSTRVIHLHGELNKAKSVNNEEILSWPNDINIGDICKDGYQIRPHIVWFGEAVPMIDLAVKECETADILIIIGTSMQVYPAAGLMHYVKDKTPIYYIDPNPAHMNAKHVKIIRENGTSGMKTVLETLSLK
ncbi:NAD-dependent protein deacetylase, SIR2 family [Formosa agariphila KMM 3901]|uniref:NAD-dependent protein deacylase n=1 Tax=Formosa agariphila (strain DSM 15362 / KCTC 12365 / LMG 23005 / KMM 3901 / M-2Alg 35-1) TaxID=1347342 RepID=T2KI04_FORAG|nr:NAD-dependent deacylase [Formosa agariphila]CDF78487.1 NAD-dependent protein deacetylase, SIR2 family [Formosa agariphila KMM 3901]